MGGERCVQLCDGQDFGRRAILLLVRLGLHCGSPTSFFSLSFWWDVIQVIGLRLVDQSGKLSNWKLGIGDEYGEQGEKGLWCLQAGKRKVVN